MSPYISDDAFLPKSVNNKQKTVTLPLEEYESLVNAAKVASTEIRKAKNMLENNQIEIFIRSDYPNISHLYNRNAVPRKIINMDELWLFSQNNEAMEKLDEILKVATNHIQNECGRKIHECNTKIEHCERLVDRFRAYSARGALHRFFNEFRL